MESISRCRAASRGALLATACVLLAAPAVMNHYDDALLGLARAMKHSGAALAPQETAVTLLNARAEAEAPWCDCDCEEVLSSSTKALSKSGRDHHAKGARGGFRFNELAPGNVLVVGSGQSGVQLATLLVEEFGDRRDIYLSCSAAGGCPRNFRGHDVFYWMHRMKLLYIPKEALAGMPPEKAEALRYGSKGSSPVTGPNRAMSPFSLDRSGVILTGKLKEVVCSGDGKGAAVEFHFNDDRCQSLQAAKDGHSELVGMFRDFASKVEAESDERFPTEVPEAEWELTNGTLLTDPGILCLDADKAAISNVLWACGWASDLGWLKVDQDPTTNDDFNERTKLPDRIISEKYPGLFFAGFPWLGTSQSMNIVNMDKDAEVIGRALC